MKKFLLFLLIFAFGMGNPVYSQTETKCQFFGVTCPTDFLANIATQGQRLRYVPFQFIQVFRHIDPLTGVANNTERLNGKTADDYLKVWNCAPDEYLWGVNEKGEPICRVAANREYKFRVGEGVVTVNTLAHSTVKINNQEIWPNQKAFASNGSIIAFSQDVQISTMPGVQARLFTHDKSGDNTLIHLAENTSIVVRVRGQNQAGEQQTTPHIRLQAGVLWGRILSDVQYDFENSSAVIGVRGTGLFLEEFSDKASIGVYDTQGGVDMWKKSSTPLRDQKGEAGWNKPIRCNSGITGCGSSTSTPERIQERLNPGTFITSEKGIQGNVVVTGEHRTWQLLPLSRWGFLGAFLPSSHHLNCSNTSQGLREIYSDNKCFHKTMYDRDIAYISGLVQEGKIPREKENIEDMFENICRKQGNIVYKDVMDYSALQVRKDLNYGCLWTWIESIYQSFWDKWVQMIYWSWSFVIGASEKSGGFTFMSQHVNQKQCQVFKNISLTSKFDCVSNDILHDDITNTLTKYLIIYK